MSSTTSIAITGMRAANKLIATASNNIANSETAGFKAGFVQLSNIPNNNGVQSKGGYEIDKKGAFEYTGIVTDLATNNNSFFVVKNKINGERLNVATGSFRPNANGELEYLDKYILLGAKYDSKGNLPGYDVATLESIIIRTSEESQPTQTSEIKEQFSLNAGLLAKGQASFVMTPKDTVNRSATKNLNGILNSGGALQPGNGFAIHMQEEENGEIVTKTVRCVFTGPITSKSTLTSTGVEIATAPANDELEINYNGVKTSIKRSEIASLSTTSNNDAIDNIIAKLTAIGLSVTKDISSGNPQIVILPPNQGNESLIISGPLAIVLGLNQSAMPIQKDSMRFTSMNDLKNALAGQFSEIVTEATSDSMLFIAKPNTNISLENLQSSADVLGALGMYEGAIKGQGYDPYDSNRNMASRSIQPDMTKSVALFDSKGQQHLATVSLKKIEDGWIQELHMSKDNLVNVREDGLLQVTKFSFDTNGNLVKANAVVPTVTTVTVSDIFATIPNNPSSTVQTFTVNGKVFTKGTDFNSMIDLVNAINKDSTTSTTVQATIFEDGDNFYKIKLISKDGSVPTATGTVLAVNPIQTQIPDASKELQIKFNSIVGAAPLNITFEYTKITELVHNEMFGDISANGMGASILTSFSIDNYGTLVGTFANGSKKNLFKIPVATYANVNGLEVAGDNAFRASAKSGKMDIVGPGESKGGEVLSGNIENSNVEQARELTMLVTGNQFSSMNVKAWSTGNAMIDTLINATK